MTASTESRKASKPLPAGMFCQEPSVAVDCPPWCTLEQGHLYDSNDEEHYLVRWHRLTFGDEESDTFVDVTVRALGGARVRSSAPLMSACGSTETQPAPR